LDPRPLKGESKNKMRQNKAKPTWHHFGGKDNWFRLKNRAQRRVKGLENQDAS
jgi:hypothetical protein